MISVDNYVVVQREKTYRLLKVGKDQQVAIDKLRFSLENAVGQPYGTVYLVNRRELTRIEADAEVETNALETNSSNNLSADDGNNFVQQQVSREDLSQMKKDGTPSTAIVAKLVEGCATFKDKSMFAKEKYVARKKKKHSDIIRLFQPTIHLLNEIYYRKDPEKIAFLRVDNLSLVLTMANVHSGTKVMVVENCSGLLTAAVLERLGGDGVCLNLHKGVQQQCAPCLAAMNFSDEIMSAFYPFPLDEIFCQNFPPNKSLENETKIKTDDNEQKMARKIRQTKAATLYFDGQFDSFILACKYHPLELLKTIFLKLKISRPFVIYSPYVQPLLDCYQWLRDQGTSVNLNLSENFYRRYQVLPDRTHPEMNQNIVGGFILSGISVEK